MELEKLDAWRPLLAEELKKQYFAALAERVDAAYGTQAVFPPREELFTAFELTPPEAVRVVILGQDPYHEPGQAHGLAFSVRMGVKLPPSPPTAFAFFRYSSSSSSSVMPSVRPAMVRAIASSFMRED